MEKVVRSNKDFLFYDTHKTIKEFRQVALVKNKNNNRYYIVDTDKGYRVISGTKSEGYTSDIEADADFKEILNRYSGFGSRI